ncbi:hypothetical protein ACFSS8_10345 [Paracoccus kondratievae]
MLTLRIALRDWDYITPLVLGEVASEKLKLIVDRVGTLVPHVGRSDYDVAETSFSRYAQLCHDGDDSITGIPNFIMRGFRNRCVITRNDGPTSFAQLKGAVSASPAGATVAIPGRGPCCAVMASGSRMRSGMRGG